MDMFPQFIFKEFYENLEFFAYLFM